MAQPSLVRNPWSILGAWLTTLAAFAFIGFIVLEWFGLLVSPYAGLLGFVAIPAVFLLGLVIIPIGIWNESRRRHGGAAAWQWPLLDFGHRRTRRVMLAVVGLTLVNVVIVSVAGVGAVHYMDTPEFCGEVCHDPMHPEFTAHALGAHANVACVDCHIGQGATGLVQAKLNGTRQLLELVTNRFPRPIPSSPPRNLPAASETCLQCHSPSRLPNADVTLVEHEYDNDRANTDTVTTLVMHTSLVHWHDQPGRRVEFVATDAKRGTIPYVKVTEANGQVTEYFAEDTPKPPAGTLHKMDCLDCHSRPSHTFADSAEGAVDGAIAAGRVSRALPFIRKEMVAAVKVDYPNQDAAAAGIRQRIEHFYQTEGPAPAADVVRAVNVATDVYRANVFPTMKVGWGTYPNQLSNDGCFRCHDDDHKSRDGSKVIKQDCDLCHLQS